MTDLLYRWPEPAKFGRVVAKNKFYERGAVSAVVRERFVGEVERITWAYKLAEETINLPSSDDVPEIQVLVIEARRSDVSQDVLIAIDKAIRQPIIFEVVSSLGTRMTGSPKQLGTGTPKLGAYYTTAWLTDEGPREALPTAIDLAGLYAAIMEPLAQVSVRPGEDVSDVAARLDRVRRLEREVAALERKLRTEPQFNRKIDLRRTLMTKQAELSALK